MNILEQILEKIEHEAMTNKEIGRKQCEGMARAMNIIRSYIDDVTGEDIHSKCSECSRRKWYQIGYQDGKKDACKDNWISVEKRLPDIDTDVIITDRDGNVYTNVTYGFAKESDEEPSFNEWTPDMWQNYKYDVIAWTRLPKPYKAE